MAKRINKAQKNAQLFWEKYRPHSVEDLILFPRLQKLLESPSVNLLFSGTPGIGKTTLARILLQDYEFLEINMSSNNGIDIVRNQIDQFCRLMTMSDKPIKWVYLEEFDRATPAAQDALRAMIEGYETNVRWIATCNSPDKLTDAIKSRFIHLDFRPASKEETQWLLEEQINRLSLIAQRENVKISEEQIKQIVHNNFPDMRKEINELHAVHVGLIEKTSLSGETLDKSFYKLLYKGTDTQKNWDWVFEYCSSDYEIFEYFKKAGRPFFKLIRENISASQLGELCVKWNYYNSIRDTVVDPYIFLLSYMYEVQKVLTTK